MKYVVSFFAIIGVLGLSSCSIMGSGDKSSKDDTVPSKVSDAKLENCPETLGTIALEEDDQADWYRMVTQTYKLPPTANLLRVLIQKSNCFVVVERRKSGMSAMERERALSRGGEGRANSNYGGGQMVAADYALTPSVELSDEDSGGVTGGGILSALPGASLLGIGGGAKGKTKDANVMLTVVDNRSSVQIAAEEGYGKAKDSSFSGGIFGIFSGTAGSGGGSAYTKTPQGRVFMIAFTDAYNQVVQKIRNYKAQTVKGGLGKGGRLKVSD